MFSWSGLGSSSESYPLEYNIPKAFMSVVIIIAHVHYYKICGNMYFLSGQHSNAITRHVFTLFVSQMVICCEL